MDVLGRYESLVDEPAAFRAACERPLPTVVRVNTLKTSVDRACRALDAAGIDHEPDWLPELRRVDVDKPGNTWPYVHGWLYGQEAVSAIPAVLLAPEPGERVLDACAAPGSKTTQLAALLDDRGTLVANDDNLGRLAALRSNADRCGVTCAVVTCRDARHFSLDPFDGARFDRVLVDAPCTCEGTVRKNPGVLADWSPTQVDGVAAVQVEILRRAIQMTRPGGTVVYATCTFAPEENEAVLDAVLASEPCAVVDVDLPLETRPGVTAWRGETYDPTVADAVRIYPHLNDTGGFFCAKLAVGA